MSAPSQPLLRVDRVVKTYESSAGPVHAVQGVSLDLQRGAFAALVGPSGCGKTTLLNAIGGLDRVTSGQIWIDETEITALTDRETIEFRLHRIGFVFQAYNLVPVLNAWENVAFVMELQGIGVRERRDRAFELLAAVGLTDCLAQDLRTTGKNVSASVLVPSLINTNIGTSGRNRQERWIDRGREATPDAEFVEAMLAESTAAGMDSNEVADLVFDAVEAGNFWIPTQPSYHDQIRARHEDMQMLKLPTPPTLD